MPLLAGIGPLGVPELLIIGFIVILVFGVGRLPEVGGALGKGIREFRKSTKDDDEAGSAMSGTAMSTPSADLAASPPETASASDRMFCGECGKDNPRSSKFCSSCGKLLGSPVH